MTEARSLADPDCNTKSMILRPAAAWRHTLANSESAGKTAMPFNGKALIAAECSSATAATVAMNS